MLIRLLLTRPGGHATAVVDLQMNVPGGGYAWRGAGVPSTRAEEASMTHRPPHRNVATHLGIPLMAWRLAAPDAGRQVTRHPNWVLHQLVADWIAYEWGVQASRAADVSAEPPLPPPRHAPATSDTHRAALGRPRRASRNGAGTARPRTPI
mmetsp:Transcript_8458/g.25430  ORF Transcript_8458/g.25430 Transcript_8458/m.25430 type:complete len:151 (+) Transcript_8458:607-1059(+)